MDHKIKYPRNFAGNTREITLSGEGYFDVAYNSDVPFIVKTGKLNVKALGTEFNVHAYPDNDFIAMALTEGKVVIEKTVTMVPGQHVEYNTETTPITYKVLPRKRQSDRTFSKQIIRIEKRV